MPPDTPADPNNVVLSRELYNLILSGAALPVLLFLIALSWVIINYLMSPANRQKRRNREIRKAVAARAARLAESNDAQTIPHDTST